MPNDPSIYPGIPNANQQLIQRIGALEAKVNSMEQHRDIVVTPFLINTVQTASGTYYGGRLWIVVGGSANWSNPPSAGNKNIGLNVLLNGVAFRNINATAYAAAINDPLSFALPVATSEFTRTTLLSTYGLVPGGTLSLTCALTGAGPGTSGSVSGIVIEWPQA